MLFALTCYRKTLIISRLLCFGYRCFPDNQEKIFII